VKVNKNSDRAGHYDTYTEQQPQGQPRFRPFERKAMDVIDLPCHGLLSDFEFMRFGEMLDVFEDEGYLTQSRSLTGYLNPNPSPVITSVVTRTTYDLPYTIIIATIGYTVFGEAA
jgi:hypothetical protein